MTSSSVSIVAGNGHHLHQPRAQPRIIAGAGVAQHANRTTRMFMHVVIERNYDVAMFCPHCGAQNKDEQPKFCSSCGKTFTVAAAPAAPLGPQGPGILAPGQEEVFFEGRPASIQSLGGLLLAFLTVGISWLYVWLKMRGVKYRITSQRIIIERGLFSPKLEQVDLYRIVDYVVERPFFQRMLGTGNIVFETLDKTQPEVRIEGIRTDVIALYERIRAATEAEKRRRGVALVDMEHQ